MKKPKAEIKNALIESAVIDASDGFLSVWLDLKYDKGGQGFGEYAVYLPANFSHHSIESPAGHFIWRCMQIADVGGWCMMEGRAIRVDADASRVFGVGHITKNDWFYPDDDLKPAKEKA